MPTLAAVNLETAVEQVFRVTPRQRSALAKLGIRTARDILFHFPSRYESLGGLKRIKDLREGETASIIATVVGLQARKAWKSKMNMAEGVLQDETGALDVVWFRQPYVANMLRPGTRARFSGKVGRRKTLLVLQNPEYEPLADDETITTAALPYLAVYPESYGITSRWLRHAIAKLLSEIGALADPIPPEILQKYHLPALARALGAIHQPKTLGEAEGARKRFSFEEIFLIQLSRQRERLRREKEPSFRIPTDTELLKRFLGTLPFPLTGAQERAIGDILKDFERRHPMARLLEGDVGSGKTLVAAAAALNAVAAGYQVAYLAPTEILSRQHFAEFIKRLAPFKIRIGLLTGAEAKKFPSKVNPRDATHISKSQMIRWCRDGEIQILIGTHALIEEKVQFKKLGFAVVDEQHRFGVRQRQKATKGVQPHFLSMSATPIPRTLALTMYGDLDLSVLDEMPPGREPIETRIIAPSERDATYALVRREVQSGGQVFVICPKIEEKNTDDDAESGKPQSQAKLDWAEVKSAKAEYKKLSEEVFPDLRIGLVHGRLKPTEKESVMQKFRKGDLDILVATSVIEVGVDVPNASIMMIEGGERFGLAQLHQFRGRVGRGTRKSYCFVFTTNGGETRRLEALRKAKTGFELAEYDLQFRGAGELSGSKQWGVSDVGMEALKNIKMVEAARAEAQELVARDADLAPWPLLAERVQAIDRQYHFE